MLFSGLKKVSTPWPTPEWADVYSVYAEHAAWYSGNPLKLANYYAGKAGPFWGRIEAADRSTMVHIPIAGDISTTSSDLLFGEAPKVLVTESPTTQDRLEEILTNTGFYSRLLEAAEFCSAFGGVFLKVNYDRELSEYPIVSVAPADTAIPIFKFGFLQGVTFWKQLNMEIDGDEAVYRFMEEHRKGVILNRLYRGDLDDLGTEVPLNSYPQTQGIPPVIETGIDDILVRYIPNKRPNKIFIGSDIGSSDYSGCEGLMDMLDEVYTSWIRDIRLGQGRIIVPEALLSQPERGRPYFDLDKEVFTVISTGALDIMGQDKGLGISYNQFKIRTDEHYRAALQFTAQIISNAGYAPQTFGLNITGTAGESGTALNIKERKSIITTSKKARFWKQAIEDICYLILAVDRMHGSSVEVLRPTVEMKDGIPQDMTAMATSVGLLRANRLISLKTGIKMVNPDLDEAAIEAEAQEIMAEEGVFTAPPQA